MVITLFCVFGLFYFWHVYISRFIIPRMCNLKLAKLAKQAKNIQTGKNNLFILPNTRRTAGFFGPGKNKEKKEGVLFYSVFMEVNKCGV